MRGEQRSISLNSKPGELREAGAHWKARRRSSRDRARAFTLIELLVVIAIIAMNCAICHHTDLSGFLAPSKTLLFMEGELNRNDYSGQVGPAIAARALSVRHNGRGHLLMADFHLETMNKKSADKIERSKRFWFPTDDLRGQNGMNFGANLPDP